MDSRGLLHRSQVSSLTTRLVCPDDSILPSPFSEIGAEGPECYFEAVSLRSPTGRSTQQSRVTNQKAGTSDKNRTRS